MMDVPAVMIMDGVFDCVMTGATASASGVRLNPARKATLSLTINSCAMRRVWSATPVSSLTMTSIFLPATVSPLICW